jgi:hypothetical protein
MRCEVEGQDGPCFSVYHDGEPRAQAIDAPAVTTHFNYDVELRVVDVHSVEGSTAVNFVVPVEIPHGWLFDIGAAWPFSRPDIPKLSRPKIECIFGTRFQTASLAKTIEVLEAVCCARVRRIVRAKRDLLD